jgi:hypothetical protein
LLGLDLAPDHPLETTGGIARSAADTAVRFDVHELEARLPRLEQDVALAVLGDHDAHRIVAPGSADLDGGRARAALERTRLFDPEIDPLHAGMHAQ